MKKCSKCKEEKPFEEFYRDKSTKDGRKSFCKECSKRYYENNKEKVREQHKRWRDNNKEKIIEYQKQYRDNNKEKERERHKRYYENNKEKILEWKKQYYENNKEKIMEYMKGWKAQKYKNDPEYRLRNNISRAFHRFLNGNKQKSTSEYLKQCGYTRKELMKHLEGQFDQNMTWDNYGSYWHVDHIIPQSVFEATNEQHLKWCWSLDNLRPLEVWENISKNNRVTLEEIKKISFYEDVKHLLKD
jgi:hypothetical protein